MQPSICSPRLLAAAFTAVAATAVIAAPVAAVQAPPPVSADIRLTASDVPPGGLLTTFVGNQGIYCSIICPLLVQTGVTAAATTVAAPATFLSALSAGDVLKAIGAAAASVTGPTNTAAAAAILADGSLVAPRALNAFEVGVVGLLNVVPAAAEGIPGVLTAVQAARQSTFDALNAPIVPNPPPLAMPRGPVQVAVVSLINVGAAVIFPAFNDVLGATTAVPDAIAQELAATGDPVRAVAAGVTTAAAAGTAAVTVIAQAVQQAVADIGASEARAARPALTATTRKSTATTVSAATTAPTTERATTARVTTAPVMAKHPDSVADRATKTDTLKPRSDRDVVAGIRKVASGVRHEESKADRSGDGDAKSSPSGRHSPR